MKRFFTAFVVLALAYSLHQISRSKTFQLIGEMVTHGPTDRPMVALTFDDGPTDTFTPQILKTLADKNVHATFFLIGDQIQKNPAALHQIIAAGHEVGNHSFSHQRMAYVTPAFVRRELDQTDALLRTAGVTKAIPFRPPFGRKFLALPYVLRERGQKTMMWSLAPESDLGTDATAQDIAAYTIHKASAGDIILLHPMYSHRDQVRLALPAIIDGLRTKGLEPVTLAQLLNGKT